MNEQYLKNVLEAALLAAGKVLSWAELGQLFNEADRPSMAELRAGVRALNEDYDGRAMEIRESAGGVRVQVRREFANEVARLWPERPQRYSRALLETLALIAYRQPLTRAEIEAVRGVAVNPNITRTLFERNWVRVVGTRDLPGRPELLGTTREFLDYFGLQSLDELPALAELESFGDMNPQLALPVGDAPGNAAANLAATETAAADATQDATTDSGKDAVINAADDEADADAESPAAGDGYKASGGLVAAARED